TAEPPFQSGSADLFFTRKKVPNTAQSPDIIQCIINKSKHHERFIRHIERRTDPPLASQFEAELRIIFVMPEDDHRLISQPPGLSPVKHVSIYRRSLYSAR